MPRDVEVVGLVQLGETMDILPQKIERKFIRAAMNKGAKIFRDAIKDRAPVLTGKLKAAISIKALRPFDSGFSILVGVVYKGIKALKQGKVRNPKRTARGGPGTEDPGVYARFVEQGTFNSAPRPFIRPAFQDAKQKATEVIGKDLMEQIEQELH